MGNENQGCSSCALDILNSTNTANLSHQTSRLKTIEESNPVKEEKPEIDFKTQIKTSTLKQASLQVKRTLSHKNNNSKSTDDPHPLNFNLEFNLEIINLEIINIVKNYIGINQIPYDIIAKFEDDLHFLELILDKKSDTNVQKINRIDYYYEGGMLNGELDSKGIEFKLKTGNTKQSFAFGMAENRQILRIYKGLFKQNQYHYWGQLLRAEVESSVSLYGHQGFKVFKIQVYVGEFVEGKRSGMGILKIFRIVPNEHHNTSRLSIDNEPAYIYEGEFNLNKKEGIGKEISKDGEVYDGEFLNGKRHGKGILSTQELRYQGEFENGQFHGEGNCSWTDGRAYVGQWREGFKHGNGEFLWPDGRIFKGQYVKGQKHGNGYITTIDNKLTKGVWEKGQLIKQSPVQAKENFVTMSSFGTLNQSRQLSVPGMNDRNKRQSVFSRI